jgi:hypothetical protein
MKGGIVRGFKWFSIVAILLMLVFGPSIIKPISLPDEPSSSLHSLTLAGMPSLDDFKDDKYVLSAALSYLRHPQNQVVRTALRVIGFLLEQHGIEEAIDDLINILHNYDNSYDVTSRTITASYLGRLTRDLWGTSEGNAALEALLKSLKEEKNEMVRAAVAQALGYTMREEALPYLVYSANNDPDLLVRHKAKEAILMIKTAVSSTSGDFTTSQSSTPNVPDLFLNQAGVEQPSQEEIIKYVNSHLLFPLVEIAESR